MNVVFHGWVSGVLQFEEKATVDAEAQGLEALGLSHVLRLIALPGGIDNHMIEVEFLDEPNPAERFFRFGTDPRAMVKPIRVDHLGAGKGKYRKNDKRGPNQ